MRAGSGHGGGSGVGAIGEGNSVKGDEDRTKAELIEFTRIGILRAAIDKVAASPPGLAFSLHGPHDQRIGQLPTNSCGPRALPNLPGG